MYVMQMREQPDCQCLVGKMPIRYTVTKDNSIYDSGKKPRTVMPSRFTHPINLTAGLVFRAFTM
jgi:hypothetical protein